MGNRRRALRDVLTIEQYREMLRKAAQIEDREESIALFFYLVAMGRLGLRVGEVIHMTESWYKRDRSVISISPHEPCDCGLCRHYARQYAEEHDLEFEEVLEEYWKVKDESDRDVQVPTERDREIIQLYFEEVPYTSVSYSTIGRRLKKIAEFVDGVDSGHVYPHMMRATAATHLTWSGFVSSALDTQFGWQDEKTKERYTQKTGWRVKREFDRMWGRMEEETFLIREDPPTYTELRPDNESEMIEIDSWRVDTSVNTHPRTRDEEPLIHDLDEFADETPVALDPISPNVQARLAREHDLLKDSPAAEGYPSAKRAGVAGAGLFAVATISGMLFAYNGLLKDIITGEPTALLALGGAAVIGLIYMVWDVHEMFHPDPDEAEPTTALDRAVVSIHAAVNPIASPIREGFPSWWTGR